MPRKAQPLTKKHEDGTRTGLYKSKRFVPRCINMLAMLSNGNPPKTLVIAHVGRNKGERKNTMLVKRKIVA